MAQTAAQKAAAAAAAASTSYVQSYASPFSTAFGGTANAAPVSGFQPAGTVTTASGTVPVDSSGRASDGSMPIAAPVAYEAPKAATTAGTIPASTGPAFTQADIDKAVAAQKAADAAAASAVSVPGATNALTLAKSVLAGYGIDTADGAISNALLGLVQKNYDATTIQTLIQDPTAAKSADPNVVALANAWNTRFSGNVAREKAGLAPLSVATYLSTETQYKQVMQRAGLPAASITSDYVGKLMAADVSPVEVNQRINAAMTAITAEDPFVKAQLNQMGLGTGDMVLHLLDPATASNIIQQKVSAAQINAEAARQGVTASQDYAMQLAGQGVTQAQAAQGFGNIAAQLPGSQAIASRFGAFGNVGQVGQELQSGQFGTQVGTESAAAVAARLKRQQEQEANIFSGSAGASQQAQSLGITSDQGLS